MTGSDRTGTDWFSVYRPTSLDAIRKLVHNEAVGKGLNIKGKSAKKNNLSGFVKLSSYMQQTIETYKWQIPEVLNI